MVKVYYCFINENEKQIDISNFSLERKEYINSIKDNYRRLQSIYAWKLLQFALNQNGLINTIFTQNKGKWVEINGKINLSITHSNNLVAIAISTSNLLAIDCEIMRDRIAFEKYNKKIFNTNISNLENFYEEWTKKECLYKLGNNFLYNELNEKHLILKNENKNYSICVLYNKDFDLEIKEIDINLLND